MSSKCISTCHAFCKALKDKNKTQECSPTEICWVNLRLDNQRELTKGLDNCQIDSRTEHLVETKRDNLDSTQMTKTRW